MRLFVTIAASFFLLNCPALRAQEITVTKKARTKNPTIKIRSWSGSKRLRERIQQDIIYSDWFDLTWADKADYTLEGKTEKIGVDGLQVKLTVRSQSGASFEYSHSMKRPDWLAHIMVDTLIQKVFKNPGLCSSYLAYVKAKGGKKDIWISQFDGSSARQLTNLNSIATEPSWSFDNKYLAYTLYTRTSTKLVVYSLQKNRYKILAQFRGLNSGCSLANNDLSAAMSLSKDGQVDLYTKAVHGSSFQRLTKDPSVEASPCWSPDDSQICFVGSQSRKPTLFTIPANGGTPKRVLTEIAEAVSPDWSRVSNKICFALRKGGQYAIGVVDMSDPTHKIHIPFAAAGDWEAPSWTPDGRHLVCSRKLDGKSRLYLIDSWYGKARELRCGDGVSLPAVSHSFVQGK